MTTKIFLITITVIITLGVGYFIFIYLPQSLRVNCMQIAKYEIHKDSGLVQEAAQIDSRTYQECLKKLGIASNEE